jgi:hypothetical protein
MASRIFISHASSDDDAVTELASDLEQGGYEVWHDDQLFGGQDWWDAILERIRACDVFVFALSRASLESEACRLEMDYAVALARPLLPVLVADTGGTAMPDLLDRVQRIDYRSADKAAATRLMGSLRLVPDAPALPSPLPDPPSVPSSMSPIFVKPSSRRGPDWPLTVEIRFRDAWRIELLLRVPGRSNEVSVYINHVAGDHVGVLAHLDGTLLRPDLPVRDDRGSTVTFRRKIPRWGARVSVLRDELRLQATLDERRERLLRLDFWFLGAMYTIDNTAGPG